jgi:hypothetical protein
MKIRNMTGIAALLCVAGTAFGQATDDCAAAPSVGAGTFAFSLAGATNSFSFAGACGVSADAEDVWLKLVATGAGEYVIETCGQSADDTVLSVVSACDGTILACSDDACGAQSRVTITLTAGQEVFVRIAEFAGGTAATGNVVISAPTPPPPGAYIESGDAGDLPSTAQTVTGGTGNVPAIFGSASPDGDVDMFRITICDTAGFSASTVAGTTWDTTMFLFAANGNGLSMNDDEEFGTSLRSALTNRFTSSLPAGDYYVAVARYDRKPSDVAGADLWLDQPFDIERAPDGPGAANPVAQWTGTPISTAGAYRIDLTGVCYGSAPTCRPDLNADGELTFDDIQFFVSLYNANDPRADFNNDQEWTFDDIQQFIALYNAGC